MFSAMCFLDGFSICVSIVLFRFIKKVSSQRNRLLLGHSGRSQFSSSFSDPGQLAEVKSSRLRHCLVLVLSPGEEEQVGLHGDQVFQADQAKEKIPLFVC